MKTQYELYQLGKSKLKTQYALFFECNSSFWAGRMRDFGWVVNRPIGYQTEIQDSDYIFPSLAAVEAMREKMLETFGTTTNYTIFEI